MSQTNLEDPNVEGFHIVSNISQYFWNKKQGQFVNGTGGTGDLDGSYVVWPVAVAVQSIIDAARINKNYIPFLEESITALDKYFSPQTKGFSPTPGGDEFYSDDSAQAVICYITAYEVTHNKKYLDRAVEGTQFLMGMVDHKNGGIIWKLNQPGPTSISTSECGMAAALLAKYVSNNEQYIKFAEYCWHFIFSTVYRKDDGLILDGLKGDSGELDTMIWTYNQGTPLTLCAHLYSLTKDEKYFHSAHDLAKAATNPNSEVFSRDTPDLEARFYRDSLKFYQLLVAGFADYLMVFGDRDHELSQQIVNVVNRHLFFVYKFMRFPNQKATYHGNLKIYEIDKPRAEVYNKITGEKRSCDEDEEERKGGSKKNDFAANLMNMGAAGRTFFQSARVLPKVNF